MTTLTRRELLERIIEAVNASGWNVLYEAGISDHPFKLRIYKENQLQRLRIYIWNVSHGGGRSRPLNEYRIQVHVPRFEPEESWQVLILGWWEDGNVFAGFDFRKHEGDLGRSASLQIKLEALELAAINGIAPSDKGNREIAIAFKPELFVEYANHVTSFHSFGESRQDFQVFETITTYQAQLQNDEIINQVSRPRQRAFQIVSRSLRDHSFTSRVLNAYNYRCAFCNVQLNLIEAAHIIPVNIETSTDETRNGIALCSLHHKAYDISLATFNERYQILINDNKIENLRRINRDGEIQRFRHELRPIINVPPANRDRPHVIYVARANRIRGW